MNEKVTLVPVDPDKVILDLQGVRIGSQGIRVPKVSMDSYYRRRMAKGDLRVMSDLLE